MVYTLKRGPIIRPRRPTPEPDEGLLKVAPHPGLPPSFYRLYSFIGAFFSDILGIIDIVHKGTLPLACRTLFGRCLILEVVTTCRAFPALLHCLSSMISIRVDQKRSAQVSAPHVTGAKKIGPLDYFFQRPCKLQYSRAVIPSSSSIKVASGASPGLRYCLYTRPPAITSIH